MIPQWHKIQTHKSEIYPLSYPKVRLFSLMSGLGPQSGRFTHRTGGDCRGVVTSSQG